MAAIYDDYIPTVRDTIENILHSEEDDMEVMAIGLTTGQMWKFYHWLDKRTLGPIHSNLHGICSRINVWVTRERSKPAQEYFGNSCPICHEEEMEVEEEDVLEERHFAMLSCGHVVHDTCLFKEDGKWSTSFCSTCHRVIEWTTDTMNPKIDFDALVDVIERCLRKYAPWAMY
jgi:transcription elongation factor Elf1